MGWALHMMALVTSTSGRMTEALPLYDRALIATQADPALADLRLLGGRTSGRLHQAPTAFVMSGSTT